MKIETPVPGPSHVVLMPFTEAKPLSRGELVDARDWPNVGYLERQGYVRPVTPRELDVIPARADG